MTSKDLMKMNYENYKWYSEQYPKLVKKLLRSIPKTILINYLKEIKIIKVDYITKKVSVR